MLRAAASASAALTVLSRRSSSLRDCRHGMGSLVGKCRERYVQSLIALSSFWAWDLHHMCYKQSFAPVSALRMPTVFGA